MICVIGLFGVCHLINTFIRKTCPCNIYPLKPHFYIVKLGYEGVYLFFLFLLQNIDLFKTYVLSKNKKNIKNFLIKFFPFLQLKKSLYIAWASFRNVSSWASFLVAYYWYLLSAHTFTTH